MLGLIQSHQLLVSGLLEHAALNHGDTEIVSYTLDEGCFRYDYAGAESRARKLAKAMLALRVEAGDRIGTLAWNTHRHLELFFSVPGIEAVCHTVNPRLFDEQLLYIINHAEDRFIFLDTSFVELAERLAPDLTSVEGWIIMTDEAHMPETTLANVHCYETLLAAQDDEYTWPTFDENTASSLCYTSGTTGDPKGVLYANRSTVIHTLAAMQPDVHNMSSLGTILPIAPMFHANSWGIPYCAAAAGTKMVLMGRDVGGENIARVIEEEGATYALAVPTVWLDYLNHVESSNIANATFVKVGIGGTAPPRSMYERFNARGVEVRQGWGMTEMSPLGTFGTLKGNQMDLGDDEKLDIQIRQGRGMFGVEMAIFDDDDNLLPRDGKTSGFLKVRGPWVTNGYFRRDDPILDDNNWFDTGDIAKIYPDGFLQLTDRAKDVVKSGGEWISSMDLENEAMGCPGVMEAAVIGAYHPKWDERPLLIVVADNPAPTKEDVLDYLAEKVAKWWLPDDIVFVDELPHTGTGKVLKSDLRQQFKGYELPTAG